MSACCEKQYPTLVSIHVSHGPLQDSQVMKQDSAFTIDRVQKFRRHLHQTAIKSLRHGGELFDRICHVISGGRLLFPLMACYQGFLRALVRTSAECAKFRYKCLYFLDYPRCNEVLFHFIIKLFRNRKNAIGDINKVIHGGNAIFYVSSLRINGVNSPKVHARTDYPLGYSLKLSQLSKCLGAIGNYAGRGLPLLNPHLLPNGADSNRGSQHCGKAGEQLLIPVGEVVQIVSQRSNAVSRTTSKRCNENASEKNAKEQPKPPVGGYVIPAAAKFHRSAPQFASPGRQNAGRNRGCLVDRHATLAARARRRSISIGRAA